MAAYEVLLLNTAIPQIQAAQSGDTYVVPRDIAFSTVANLANGTYLLPSLTFSSDPDTGVFRQGANALGFTAGGGSDQMVLTSTGLGIGTNNPAAKLDVRNGVAGEFVAVNALNTLYDAATAASSTIRLGITNSVGVSYATIKAAETSNDDYPSLVFGVQAAVTTNPTERMRIDSSGNLGLGVTTPSPWSSGKAVEINTVGNGVWGASQTQTFLTSNVFYNSGFKFGGTGYATALALDGGDFYFYTSNASGSAGGSVTWTNTNTAAMTLNSSGNLGLGVTPSVWNTGYKAFVAGGTNSNNQVGGIASGSGITIVSTNYYRSTAPSDLYAGDGFAMKYTQSSGQHIWETAASGTAGNAISFTTAMTLDASGNLAVGTTSIFPAPRLSVYNGATLTTGGDGGGNGVLIAAATGAASTGQLVVAGSDTAAIDKGGAIVFAGKWDTATNNIAQWAKIVGYKENATNNNYAGYLGFYTRADGGSATERARITSGGDMGIGTNNPASRLHVTVSGSTEVARFETTTDNTPSVGIYSNGGIRGKLRASTAEMAVFSQGSIPLLLGVNDAEKARITSDGNLLVGETASNSGNNGLKVKGQFALTTAQTFTASGSVNDSAYYIVCYALSATCTLTLPTPANNTGRLLNIVVQSAQQVVSASSNVTAIADGAVGTAILPATAGKWAQLWCDGAYWNIIATNV